MTADPTPYQKTRGDYGSLLRDMAGTTALAAEAGESRQPVPALLTRSRSLDMRLNATTTQEKAWMLRAAYELSRQRQPLNVTMNGAAATPRDGAVRLAPTLAQLAQRAHLPEQGAARGVAHRLGDGVRRMRRCPPRPQG